MIVEYSGNTTEQKVRTLRDSVQRALEEVTESYSNDIVKETKETRTIIKVVERQTSSLVSGKADIDLANVSNAWIENGVIVDESIGSSKIASLTANKITSGTLDCGNITVLNLNAGSINAGALTVGGVTLNISADTASITGTVIQNGTIPKSSLSSEVQDLLDGAVETFTTDAVPTLSNYPASQWSTTAEKETHIGDVCYVVNQSLPENGYSYRFSYLNSVFSWERISDSDVTRALAEIAAMQDDIDGLTTWKTSTISWIDSTDDSISAVQGRLTSAETSLGSKVDITTFNSLSSTVDSNSASISSLTNTVASKADGSTVSTLSTKVNAIEQTADGTTSKVSNLITVLGTNSDGTTKTGDVVQRMNLAETAITQHANAITLKANASDVYTKTAIDDEFALYAKLADFTVAPDEISSTITEAISTAEGYTDSALSSALASYYTKSQIDQTVNGINLSIESKQSISGMSAYQTVAGMDAYQTVAGMSSYYTKSDIDLSLGEITLSVEALDEAKMDVSGMSDYQLVADMDDYQTVAGMSDYQTVSGMASYYTKAEIDITNTSITNRITAAETNVSGEVTSRTTLIRSFNGGTLTAYQGEPCGVYTNASGSVDIVTLSWSGTTPTITGVVARYGSDSLTYLSSDGETELFKVATATESPVITEQFSYRPSVLRPRSASITVENETVTKTKGLKYNCPSEEYVAFTGKWAYSISVSGTPTGSGTFTLTPNNQTYNVMYGDNVIGSVTCYGGADSYAVIFVASTQYPDAAITFSDMYITYQTDDRGVSKVVMGTYPDTSESKALYVGNGYSDDNRENAFTVDWDGNAATGNKYYFGEDNTEVRGVKFGTTDSSSVTIGANSYDSVSTTYDVPDGWVLHLVGANVRGTGTNYRMTNLYGLQSSRSSNGTYTLTVYARNLYTSAATISVRFRFLLLTEED